MGPPRVGLPVRRDPPDTVLRTIRLKGVAVRATREFVVERFGSTRWDELLAELPADTKKALGGRILDSGWVTMDHVNRFSLAVDRMLGKNDGALLQELGAAAAKVTFTGVYRAFARLVDPKTILRRVNTMYKSYCDTGHFDTEIVGDDTYLTLTELPTPWSACQIMTGFMRQVVIQLNKESTVEQVACQADGGARSCKWRIHYPGLSGALGGARAP